MTATLINANPFPEDYEFDQALGQLRDEMIRRSDSVSFFLLREMKIRYCVGCWDCWWKTPGRCRHRDDMEEVHRAIVNSRWLIFATPLVAGFVSSLLKKLNDRMIPLIHPYMDIIQGECHHLRRYPHYPYLGLILREEEEGDSEDMDITAQIYRRFAINFHSQLRFVHTHPVNRKEVLRATGNI